MNIGVVFMNALNKVIPKTNVIIFESYPNISDNAYALYSYVINNREDLKNAYQIIWAKKGIIYTKDLILDSNTNIVEKKSIRGIFCFLRAKYVISTHGYFRGVRSGKDQKQINLWHGCGYKDLPPEDCGYHGDMAIVTSEVYRDITAKHFELDSKNVYVTGYPRNDLLFNSKSILKKINIDKSRFSKVILWMPTYRKAVVGHSGVDGKEGSFTASYLKKEDWDLLQRALLANKFMLIVKPHPMDTVQREFIGEYGNIKCITADELQYSGLQLYELLAESDALLSDYSSVIVDYLLLDKPIAMVLSDMKEYKENRGFLFNPVDAYFPGPIMNNLNDLILYFNHFDEINEEWISKRKQITSIMHQYRDNLSSRRVAEIIWGMDANK